MKEIYIYLYLPPTLIEEAIGQSNQIMHRALRGCEGESEFIFWAHMHSCRKCSYTIALVVG